MITFDRALQVVSVIAIVVSLVYVASEIRQNTLSIRNASHQTSVAMSLDANSYMLDSQFADIYIKGLNDYQSLTDRENLQFGAYVSGFLNIFEYSFYSYEDGLMDDEYWDGVDQWMRSELRGDAWSQLWLEIRQGFGGQFREYVDSLTEGE